MRMPDNIFSGHFSGGHCQGIAVDTKGEYIYYSFTTALIKTDMAGNLVGSVTGLLGHLGCLAFCREDGKLYGSLEYKSDAIGRGILRNIGSDAQIEDAFHIAIFDVEKIVRPGMDACGDGVMTTVFLKDVLEDYSAQVRCGGRILHHRHGCSGIDGVTFAPIPSENGRKYLFVAYGVYGDVQRSDNDYQVLLCYDTREWDKIARPLRQDSMHKSGPEGPLHKYFVHTGNTNYGVQNLEYHEEAGCMLMAVYPGSKPEFVNRSMYAVDMTKPAAKGALKGVEPETEGEILSIMGDGWDFPYGSTGICALGDGRFAVSLDGRDDEGYYTNVKPFVWNGTEPLAMEMNG